MPGRLTGPLDRQLLGCLAAGQPAAGLWNKWIWVLLIIYRVNPNARRGVAAGDVGRVGCSYGYCVSSGLAENRNLNSARVPGSS